MSVETDSGHVWPSCPPGWGGAAIVGGTCSPCPHLPLLHHYHLRYKRGSSALQLHYVGTDK